jgi:hypothetical protein
VLHAPLANLLAKRDPWKLPTASDAISHEKLIRGVSINF